MCTTVERSTPYFSAASRWVACPVKTSTYSSYFSLGANRRRGLPRALVFWGSVTVSYLLKVDQRTPQMAGYFQPLLVHELRRRTAVVEGSTENTTLVRGLLVGLRERGLDVTRPILAVLDGAAALAAAVKEVFDHPVIGRCQLHKLRNVRDHLPERMRGPVEKRMRAAYHADSALEAEALLTALAKELERTHPGAAASLREGMHETLTVLRLDVPPVLRLSS
jgi:hypothetical protein